MTGPTPRTPVRQARSTESRIADLESRIGRVIPGRLADIGRGPTSERDFLYGVPATTAQQAALANRKIVWFNTDKGWEETYYAPTGLAGLTARGLVVGTPAAWYPAAGTNLTATRIQSNGFQLISAGVVTGASLSPFMVNVGGFLPASTNGIELPIPGIYTVSGGVYFSGGGAMAFVACIIHETDGVGGWRELLTSRVAAGAADTQATVSSGGIRLAANAKITLSGQSAGNQNIYGDGINRRTFLSLSYEGPAVVNW